MPASVFRPCFRLGLVLCFLAAPAAGDTGPARLVADLLPGTVPFSQFISGFASVGNRTVFTRSDDEHRTSLWVSDGTSQFRARDAAHGMELWSSDGSADGTRLVQDINLGAFWSLPLEPTVTSQGLYFSANDSVHGRELWLLPEPALALHP